MTHLALGEVGRDVIGLEMAHPAMPKTVHSPSRDAEAVTKRVQHLTQQVAIIQWRSAAGLKYAASGSAPELVPEYPSRAGVNPHVAVASLGLNWNF